MLSSVSKLKPNELFPMLQIPELSELFPLPPLRLLLFFLESKDLTPCDDDGGLAPCSILK